VTATQPVLPPGLRSRVLDASRHARAAGEPVPEVPAISPAEAHRVAAGALYRTLTELNTADWSRPAIRDLDVQGLVGHLTGVEDDVQRCLAGDPAVSLAGHVESTQAAATRQAGRDPARTRDEWQAAVRRTLALVAAGARGDGADGLGRTVALHGMRLPLGALLIARAFELWIHENDIRLACGLPLAVPGPPVLRSMTRLAADLLPVAATRAALPGPGRLHLVLTGPGGGTWDVEWEPPAGDAEPDPGEVSIVADAVGFCRLAGDRITPAELDPYITGDRDQAAGVLAAAASLALD
jgi:uncharacterized protein (TIGR03083 family)